MFYNIYFIVIYLILFAVYLSHKNLHFVVSFPLGLLLDFLLLLAVAVPG